MSAAALPSGGPHPRVHLTPEIVQRLIKAFSLGASIRDAAAYAGVKRDLIEYYMDQGERDPHSPHAVFARAVHAARGQQAVRLLTIVNDEADRGNFKAAAWLLERSHGYAARAVAQVQTDAQPTVAASWVDLVQAAALEAGTEDSTDDD